MSDKIVKIYASQDWVNENTIKSWNDLEDKPFGETIDLNEVNSTYASGVVTIENGNSTIKVGASNADFLEQEESYYVEWDNVMYAATYHGDVYGIGNISIYYGDGENDTGEPFFICQGISPLYLDFSATTDGEHTYKIYTGSISTKPLDEKYIPKISASEIAYDDTNTQFGADSIQGVMNKLPEQMFIKKAVFTDRLSLYSFLEEHHQFLVRAFITTTSSGTTAGNFVRLQKADGTTTGFVFSNPTIDLTYKTSGELDSVRVIGTSIEINPTESILCESLAIKVKTDGTAEMKGIGNNTIPTTTTLPDSYWSAMGVSVTLLYCE